MYRYSLAVCEDDEVILEKICQVCENTLTDMGIAHEIRVFSSAESLEETIESSGQIFDLLILDIELKDKTGMELARELRAKDDRVSILFVTGHEEYVLEGYEVWPVHFLLKPLNWEKLEEVLRADWNRNHNAGTVLLQKGKRKLRLRLGSVLYAETDGNHGVQIFQQDTVVDSFPISLSQLESCISDQRFVRCHNSYLVNLQHMREMNRTGFLTDQGHQIPISRKYYKICQEAFVSYINR